MTTNQSHPGETLPLGRFQFEVDEYLAAEDSEVIVLLHGFPQSKDMWLSIGPHLAKAGYHVIAFNQRGYSAGAQPYGVCNYSLRNLSSDVALLLNKFSINAAHIVGHDWGGSVAWQFAAEHPEMVKTLTIFSMPHPSALAAAFRGPEQLTKSLYIVPLLSPSLMRILLTWRGGMLAMRWLCKMGMNESNAERSLEIMRRPGVLRGSLRWYQALPINAFHRVDVGFMTVPTTYVWGRSDAAISRRAAEATPKFVENCDFREIDASHWIIDEIPNTAVDLILGRVVTEAR